MKNGYINDIKQQHMSFVSLHGDILGFIPWDISTLCFFLKYLDRFITSKRRNEGFNDIDGFKQISGSSNSRNG